MSDLITWLRAVLDDEERVARAATSGPWRPEAAKYGNAEDGYGDPFDWEVVSTSAEVPVVSHVAYEGGGANKPDADHIARHDPARVLAEIAAKRAILDHAERWAATLHVTPDGWTAETATAYRMAMEWTLRLLAQPYADRPGYQESWRPA